MKAAITILIILTLGLGAVLFYQHDKSIKAKKADETTIINLSNKVEDVRLKLEEQEKVNMGLEKNIKLKNEDLLKTSNVFIKVTAELEQEKKNAAAQAEMLKAEIAKKEQRIAELDAQRSDLTKKMDELNLNIDSLGKQIADTQKKLDASEGDREFLLKELKRLQAEKAELERQFNDLSILRTQVAKLKEELSVAKRLEWIRMGIYGSQEKKGAEMLMSGMTPATKPAYNLQVDLKQDGSATVVPPATNNPAPAPK